MFGTVVLALMFSFVAQQNPFLGRWNLAGAGEANAGHVYWLEIKEEGGQLSGMFLNRGGSPLKLANVKVENGELTYELVRPKQPKITYSARLEGEKLTGSFQAEGQTQKMTFTGVRPPRWAAGNANGKHTFGKPVELFNGTSLEAWGVQHASRPMGWTVQDGVMTNEAKANNLVSKEKFKDFRIQAEYKIEPGSNSGIYLRGRYELQVLDDFGKPTEEHGHMSIYAWKKPAVNASKPAGEWQTMDATIVGNKLTVVLNGQKVHDNETIEAITGGALDANENEAGPIMIQGDHGKVSFRKVVVTPITRVGS
jgi:hypothetical protein